MKKIKILSLIIAFFVVISSTIVLADEETKLVLEIETSSKELVKGETVYVTIKIKDVNFNGKEGVIGINNFKFDSDFLELAIENDNSFEKYEIDGGTSYVLKKNPLTSIDITEEDGNKTYTISTLGYFENGDEIIKIPLKVLETANTGKAEVSLEGITYLYGDADSQSGTDNNMTGSVENEIKIDIVNSKTVQTPSLSDINVEMEKTTYYVGEKIDKDDISVKAIYSDNSFKNVTNFTYTPTGELKETDKAVTVSYSEGNATKTKTINIVVNKKADNDSEDKSKDGEDKETTQTDNKTDESKTSNTVNESKTSNSVSESTTKKDITQANDGKEENLATVKLPQTGFAGAYIIIAIVVISVIAIVIKKKQSKIKF